MRLDSGSGLSGQRPYVVRKPRALRLDLAQEVLLKIGDPDARSRRSTDSRPATCVIISAVYPHPLSDGKRVVLKGLLDYLIARFGAENVHYLLLANEVPPGTLPCTVHLLGKPRVGRQLWNVLTKCVFGRRQTLQEAMIASPAVGARLQQLREDLTPDLEIYDTVRLAQLVENHPADTYRVLYLDDLFSVRYDRMLRQMREDPGADVRPLGEFANHVPRSLRWLGGRPSVYRPLLRFETRRLAAREAECSSRFDLGLLVNADEVDTLRTRAPETTIEVLTPLITESVPPARRVDGPVFVFLGLLSQPHNEDALTSFLTTTLPAALEVLPDLRLRIVGKGASPELTKLAASFGSSVQLEGFVDDLASVLSTCTALLAPLRFGSGVKIKVIEAIGRGVPVIATWVAAEGISSQPWGQDGLYILDDYAQWPAVMQRLSDPAVNAEASAAALRFYRRTYSTSTVFRAYDRLFASGWTDDDLLAAAVADRVAAS